MSPHSDSRFNSHSQHVNLQLQNNTPSTPSLPFLINVQFSALFSGKNSVEMSYNWAFKGKRSYTNKTNASKSHRKRRHHPCNLFSFFFFFNFSFSFVKISSCPVYSADHLCVKIYNPTTATLLSAFSKTPFCPFWFWKIADKHQLKCSCFMFEEKKKKNLRFLPYFISFCTLSNRLFF